MRHIVFTVGIFALLLGCAGQAAASPIQVYLLSTGVAAEDNAVDKLLTNRGDQVTIGPTYTNFSGAGLSGYNVVLLLQNNNSFGGNLPTSGQSALVNFVQHGGGLVTSEWTVWGNAAPGYNYNPTLEPAIPVIPSSSYSYNSPITYMQSTPNSTLNAGVSPSFTFAADSNGGTETYFAPKPGATVYYDSSYGAGLIGWNYGTGTVLSFSTLAGQAELGNANYGQLFGNAVQFAAGPEFASAPEPATLTMFGIATFGLLGYCGWRRRRMTTA